MRVSDTCVRSLSCATCTIAAMGWIAGAPSASADFPNLSANASANGMVSGIGPTSASLIWSRTNMQCLISWVPLIHGDRVFLVRQTYASAPYNPPPGEARVHCLDLQSGVTLWTFDCPFVAGQWTTVVYGASGGRVYVGRGGNGGSSAAPVHCLDAQTGAVLWISQDDVRTGAYEGIIFMDNGDPIFASHTEMRRIDALTGETVWFTSRSCSVSGNCGPARDGDAIYVDEAAPGGQRISRFSATTGQRLYSSATMPGFLCQNQPFCAPGGIVFYLRTSNEGVPDRFYAFRDTGAGFETLWSVPARTEAGTRHATTPDGGVTMLSPEGRLQIRDQLTGALRAESPAPVLAAHGFTTSMVTVDSRGRIFHNNSNGAGGFAADIRVFDAVLQPEWSLSITGVNQGGPSIAADGSLVLAGTGLVRRYWTPTCAQADLNCDGRIDGTDLTALLAAWGQSGAADLDGSGTVDGLDLSIILAAWG